MKSDIGCSDGEGGLIPLCKDSFIGCELTCKEFDRQNINGFSIDKETERLYGKDGVARVLELGKNYALVNFGEFLPYLVSLKNGIPDLENGRILRPNYNGDWC